MPYELGFGSFFVGLVRARFNFDKLADRWARTDQRTGAELTRSIAKTTAAGFAVPGAGELAPLAHVAIHAGDARRPLPLAGRNSPEAGSMVLNDLTSGRHSVGYDLLRGLRRCLCASPWSITSRDLPANKRRRRSLEHLDANLPVPTACLDHQSAR